ncbi:hypothetical protein ABW19_dt0205493 [Dactylella cylindrospora]|nr:hypothetical protein ABW19_dt0205493 [Dactylella cylindrospora]
MAPHSKILLIRHGEATHNLRDDFDQHDPGLTKQGKEQCQKLLRDAFDAGEWPHWKKLDLVAISPLRRTLETGFLVFDDLVKDGLAYIIYPELQETSDRPCDTGRPTAELKLMFPGIQFDECDRTNWLQKKHGFYTRANLETRAIFVRKWLYERPEEVIAVVTHSGFLRWLAAADFPFVEPRDSFRNCEFRGYTFADIKKDDGIGAPYKLVEEQWSIDLRKVKRGDGFIQAPSGELVPTSAQTISPEDQAAGGSGGGEDAEDPTDAPTIIF